MTSVNQNKEKKDNVSFVDVVERTKMANGSKHKQTEAQQTAATRMEPNHTTAVHVQYLPATLSNNNNNEDLNSMGEATNIASKALQHLSSHRGSYSYNYNIINIATQFKQHIQSFLTSSIYFMILWQD